MDPKVWGRSGWIFLFSVALCFPENPSFQQIHNYTRFFNYLQYVLPCEICRLHYAGHLNQVKIDQYVTSRDNLFLWVLKVHNLVNKQTGKPSITRADVLRIYFDDNISLSESQIPDFLWEYYLWKFIFSIAYGYPRKPNFQEIINYKRFFTYLQYVLPCNSYRKKYYSLYIQLPIDPYLTTTEYFFEWVIKIHNGFSNTKIPILNKENDVIGFYFKEQLAKGGKMYVKDDNNQAKGYGLIEGYHNVTSVNPNNKNLLNKNISLGILILLTCFVICGKSG